MQRKPEVPASPRGEALFRCARPSGVPRGPATSTTPRSLSRLTSIESVMPSSHLILCCPLLLLPPIHPSIRVFSNESTLRMRWPKSWTLGPCFPPPSASSGRPSNRWGMQPWVGSPCSPRDSQESPPTPEFKSINSSVLSFL